MYVNWVSFYRDRKKNRIKRKVLLWIHAAKTKRKTKTKGIMMLEETNRSGGLTVNKVYEHAELNRKGTGVGEQLLRVIYQLSSFFLSSILAANFRILALSSVSKHTQHCSSIWLINL